MHHSARYLARASEKKGWEKHECRQRRFAPHPQLYDAQFKDQFAYASRSASGNRRRTRG